jgi:antitoxin (DNA-binding transcriptional repressor) of toxin-antitoxin stability system
MPEGLAYPRRQTGEKQSGTIEFMAGKRIIIPKKRTHVRLSLMTKSYGTTVNIHEAKTHLSRIIQNVLASGEPVTIARAGKPVVIVSAHPGARPTQRALGILRGKVQLPDDLGAYDAEIRKMFEGAPQ